MISHVTIAVSDFDRARGFYLPLMQRLGIEETWLVEGREAAYRLPDQPRPLFFLTRPYEGEPMPGNGPMLGFLAHDRDTVRDVGQDSLGGRRKRIVCLGPDDFVFQRWPRAGRDQHRRGDKRCPEHG